MKKIIICITICLSWSYYLSAQSSGPGPFTLNAPTDATNIQWYKDGSMVVGETGSSYDAVEEGVYWASYDNAANLSCTGLTSNIFIVAEEDGAVNTSLIGPAGYATYQWHLDDTPIGGGTNATHMMPNEVASVGSYRLDYGDGSCTVMADNILLYILTCSAAARAITISN